MPAAHMYSPIFYRIEKMGVKIRSYVPNVCTNSSPIINRRDVIQQWDLACTINPIKNQAMCTKLHSL